MRRQTAGTAQVLEGESCFARLDPFQLPARVSYRGAARAGTAAQVAIIGADSVMIRRETGAGVPLYVTVPLRAYAGVLLSVRETASGQAVALRLHHKNGDLDVPLFEAESTEDVIADWQAWARTLARPLLIQNADGEIVEPFERLGGVVVKMPAARRANRFFAERRPRFLCKRRIGGRPSGAVFDEAEIIARDTAD
jgi:hypothetical protein